MAKTVRIRPLNINAQPITSMSGQGLGFMFHLWARKAKLFIFNKEKTAAIHMLFVFFPLIVVWLDSKKRVKQVRVMHPFVSFEGHAARYVLEAPYSKKILGKIKIGKRFSW